MLIFNFRVVVEGPEREPRSLSPVAKQCWYSFAETHADDLGIRSWGFMRGVSSGFIESSGTPNIQQEHIQTLASRFRAHHRQICHGSSNGFFILSKIGILSMNIFSISILSSLGSRRYQLAYGLPLERGSFLLS